MNDSRFECQTFVSTLIKSYHVPLTHWIGREDEDDLLLVKIFAPDDKLLCEFATSEGMPLDPQVRSLINHSIHCFSLGYHCRNQG